MLFEKAAVHGYCHAFRVDEDEALDSEVDCDGTMAVLSELD